MDWLDKLLGIGGAAIGGVVGGPQGAMAGYQAGNTVGSLFGDEEQQESMLMSGMPQLPNMGGLFSGMPQPPRFINPVQQPNPMQPPPAYGNTPYSSWY